MPKGYWVTIYRKISDPQKLAAYAELAPKATAIAGRSPQDGSESSGMTGENTMKRPKASSTRPSPTKNHRPGRNRRAPRRSSIARSDGGGPGGGGPEGRSHGEVTVKAPLVARAV